eukprot:296584-Prorocentrum_minimum.AAC.3
MACIASQTSAFAVRAQADASVTASVSTARKASFPARKSFNGVALAKGFNSQKLSMSRRVETQAIFGKKDAKKAASKDPSIGTTYEADIPKPVKCKFARGNDGGAYVIQVPNDPLYKDFEVGDKIVKIRCDDVLTGGILRVKENMDTAISFTQRRTLTRSTVHELESSLSSNSAS